MNKLFLSDYYRITNHQWSWWKGILEIIFNHEIRYLFLGRIYSLNRNKFYGKVCGRLNLYLGRLYGFEFVLHNIGAGLYIGHGYNITINSEAIIGKCCNIHKGVTIGQESRGKRKGCPRIGNYVWIGVNATVVGNIKIGNDVMIIPNSFVNCDVPDHSIVIGNPCKIILKKNATEGYILNKDIDKIFI